MDKGGNALQAKIVETVPHPRPRGLRSKTLSPTGSRKLVSDMNFACVLVQHEPGIADHSTGSLFNYRAFSETKVLKLRAILADPCCGFGKGTVRPIGVETKNLRIAEPRVRSFHIGFFKWPQEQSIGFEHGIPGTFTKSANVISKEDNSENLVYVPEIQ